MTDQTPRKITAAIMLAFTLFFAFEHFRFYIPVQDILATILQRFDPTIGLERLDFDQHMRAHKIKAPHLDVAILQINEPSIQALGRFPFSRKVYADLLEKLEKIGVRSVAFDIVFSERENDLALKNLQLIREQIKNHGASKVDLALIDTKITDTDGDGQLAEILRKDKMPVVLGMAFSDSLDLINGAKGLSPNSLQLLRQYSVATRDIALSEVASNSSATIPIIPETIFLEAASKNISVGNFSTAFDSDSVLRRAPLITEFQGAWLPSLSIRGVEGYLQTHFIFLNDHGYRLESEDGKYRVPISVDGGIYPKFYGGGGEIKTYEMIDALNGKLDKELRGKLLFLGVTAVGLKDIRANPYAVRFPGVEAHATIASNILNQDFLVKDAQYFRFGYLWLLVFGSIIAYVAFYMHPLFSILIAAVLLLAMNYTNQVLFNRGHFVPTFYPALEFMSILAAGILYRYLGQEKERKYVREAFAHYVSGSVVAELMRDHSKLKLGGQKKELTVVFCDMVGFTKFSESMDAAFLTQLLNQFFTRMTGIILDNRGTLDKYMGDAIMCFWGAPLELEAHASLACKAALEMLNELQAINAEWQAKYNFSINLRIGINTGDMSVGNMGSEQVFNYTVLGDNVNLGSRLEGVNTIYGTRILVGDRTFQLAKKDFCFRHVDTVAVKGKDHAVDIYELVDFISEQNKYSAWSSCYESAFAKYRVGAWNEALVEFKRCVSLQPSDFAAAAMITRIEKTISPPDNWDGAWHLDKK